MTELSDHRVIVTGGAGFIGCALSERLADKVAKWVVIDSLHPQVHPVAERPAELHEAAELVVGDVTDPAVWEAVLAETEPTVVIHLAAETGTAQSLDEATRHAHVNVVGTTVMLDALSARGIVPERFLLSSSRAVYGEGAWQKTSGEVFYPGQRSHAQFEAGQWDFEGATPLPSSAAATVPAPTSVYGSTKLAQEHILSAWVNARDTTLTTLRLQNVYGPGQSLTNPYTGIVSLFSQLAQRGQSIPIYEDGLITRDFVYIDDVADAFVAGLALPTESASITRDIGSGVGTTIMQLAESIARYHDAPAPHITGKYRDGDVRHAECTIADTLSTLDWSPQWTVDAGVAGLQDWIAAQQAKQA